MYRLAYLFMGLVFVSVSRAQTRFDRLIDEILWETEQTMIQQNKTAVSIPDIIKSFDKKFLFIHLKGDFEVLGAKVANLSTIHRIGDVIPVQNDDVQITATFGLKDLAIHVDQIKIDFLFIHFTEGIDVKIDKNAVFFKVSLHYDQSGNCSVILNEAKLTSLGGFHTTLLPTGVLHTIFDWLITGTLDVFSWLIEDIINRHLTSQFNGVIQSLDLMCNKLL